MKKQEGQSAVEYMLVLSLSLSMAALLFHPQSKVIQLFKLLFRGIQETCLHPSHH